jgi:PiT family inorganic phosphate transporter
MARLRRICECSSLPFERTFYGQRLMTVGEQIGKNHLTYAQGAAAEITAMATIGAADGLGLPVSTTHVLSSGVAGTMMADHSGLQ